RIQRTLARETCPSRRVRWTIASVGPWACPGGACLEGWRMLADTRQEEEVSVGRRRTPAQAVAPRPPPPSSRPAREGPRAGVGERAELARTPGAQGGTRYRAGGRAGRLSGQLPVPARVPVGRGHVRPPGRGRQLQQRLVG